MHKALLLPLCAVVLAGCQSLSTTEVFYTPAAGVAYPPWPKGAAIPVLSEPPSWAHKTIGRFAMQSPQGYNFIYRALLHNARRNGADAVVLRKLEFDLRRTYNYIPPGWDSIPQTNVYYQSVKNCDGQWTTIPQVYTTFIPVFRPARTVVNDVQWTDVAADMIVHRDKHAMTALPPAAR